MNAAPTSLPAPLQRLGLAAEQAWLPRCADWLMDGRRDIELQDLCESAELLDGDWRPLAREQARLLQHHRGRVGVHAPFWNMQLSAQDPQVRRVVQARYLQGLDFTEEVGGQWLVLHSPFHFFGHTLVQHRPRLAQEIALAQLTLEPVLARAEQLGVTLVVENILDRDVPPLLALVESFGSPRVRLSVDVGHAHIAAQRGGLPAQHWLRQGAGALGHVHLQDNDGCADEHLAPGAGTLHWPGVLRALRDADEHAARTPDAIPPALVLEVAADQVDAAMRWVQVIGSAAAAPDMP